MKHKLLLILPLLVIMPFLSGQEVADNHWWFYFPDKSGQPSIDKPEEFLSQRSIDRRAWQGLAVDYYDLPVNQDYLDQLQEYDLEIKHISRWLNGVLVYCEDSLLMDTITKASFLTSTPWKPESKNKYYPDLPAGSRFEEADPEADPYNYGRSAVQVEQLTVHFLHEKGFRGQGVYIAVLDGGFIELPGLPAFGSMTAENRILETRNFVFPGESVFSMHNHGTSVSSIIGGEVNDSLIGTAPEATFILALTENVLSETKTEEYAWIEAAEWADSLGADIINTSLGYTFFDDTSKSYVYKDMDGKTAPSSIASSIAASRGMISVTSAGNSGNNNYIGAPADASDIIAVGAINSEETIVYFSSRGPSYDQRIKPELVALGSGTIYQGINGLIRSGSGTSFSAPLISGAFASLWQAYPTMPATELMNWVMEAGDRADEPDILYGYGLPSFRKAYYAITSVPQKTSNNQEVLVYPNPFTSEISLVPGHHGTYTVRLIDLQGRIIRQEIKSLPGKLENLSSLQAGTYIVLLSNEKTVFQQKVIKY